jgi:hypothetical protein
MFDDRPKWLESIDEMVDETRIVLDDIYGRFNKPGQPATDPLSVALRKQYKREKHNDKMLCRSWRHETVREDRTIKPTHTVGKDNDRFKDEYYN